MSASIVKRRQGAPRNWDIGHHTTDPADRTAAATATGTAAVRATLEVITLQIIANVLDQTGR